MDGVEATTSERARRRRDLVQTRAALLDSAAAVFARRGVAGATLEEIAETAGFTRGAFYHHFASKDDLVLALLARRDEELLRGYGADLLGSAPPDPAAAAARWRELHADDATSTALRLELRYHAMRNEGVRKRLVEEERAAVASTAQRLTALKTATGGSWRYPAEQVAELLHMMSRAATEQQLLHEVDATPLMEMLIRLVWEGPIDDVSPSHAEAGGDSS